MGIFAIFLYIQLVSFFFFSLLFRSMILITQLRFVLVLAPLGKFLLKVIHGTQCHLILDPIFTFHRWICFGSERKSILYGWCCCYCCRCCYRRIFICLLRPLFYYTLNLHLTFARSIFFRLEKGARKIFHFRKSFAALTRFFAYHSFSKHVKHIFLHFWYFVGCNVYQFKEVVLWTFFLFSFWSLFFALWHVFVATVTYMA